MLVGLPLQRAVRYVNALFNERHNMLEDLRELVARRASRCTRQNQNQLESKQGAVRYSAYLEELEYLDGA
jgi:hypothetical protein